jgi:hypothetical protein
MVPEPTVRSVASMVEKRAACVRNLQMVVVTARGGRAHGNGERHGMGRTADFAGDGGGAIAENRANPFTRHRELERRVEGGNRGDDVGAGKREFDRAYV